MRKPSTSRNDATHAHQGESIDTPAPSLTDGQEVGTKPRGALRLVSMDGRLVATPGVCRECGGTFIGKRSSREFCGASCRRVFNNRKAIRGTQLYDLLMTWRWDRAGRKDGTALTLFGRLASMFRQQDEKERNGRPSWDELTKWEQRNPSVKAKVVASAKKGRR